VLPVKFFSSNFEENIIFQEKNWNFLSLCHPWVSSKIFSPFGPAVWPATADIYIYERRALVYYKDERSSTCSVSPVHAHLP